MHKLPHVDQSLIFNALAINCCHAVIAVAHADIDGHLIFTAARDRLKRPSEAVESPL